MSSLSQRRAVLASPPRRPSRSMQFRAMAAQRLVAELAMGNSQQFKDDYGWDYGWPYAMSQFVPLYATSVFPRGAVASAGFNAIFTPGANDGTRPADFDPYVLPGQDDPGPAPVASGFSYQATADVGSSASLKLFVSGDGDGIDHRHRLRLHTTYGTFPSGAGSFRLQCRREDSVFNAVAEGPVISTNTGAYSIQRAFLDLAADTTRTYALGFRWARVGTTTTGPNFQHSMQVEDRDVTVGYCLTTMYGVGGKKLTEMATYITTMADVQLRNMILAAVQIQLDRGLSPMLIFAVHEGENQRNDPDPSATNYLAQFKTIWARLKYGWETLCGFPLSNLACEIRCGVPLAFPQDRKLASYDAIMEDYCRRDPAVSHFRYEDSTSFQYMADNGLFLEADPANWLHLVPQGYKTLALNDLTLHMPKVPAINKTLPTISGVRGTGQTLSVVPGTWFQAPTLSYQWYADGVAIAGATGSTFVETASQAGKALTVAETATVNGLVSSATSAGLIDMTSFVADYQGGAYFLNGSTYADETAFNTAAGITKTGITRTSTPVIIGSNLVVNGTFDTDVAGWTAQPTVTLSVVSQKMRVTRATTGQVQYVYQQLPNVEIGKAYLANWDSATISGNALSVRWGTAIGQGLYVTDAVAGTGKSAYVAPRLAAMFFSAGDAGTSNSGVGDIDNVALREVAPFPGYSGVPHTVVINAVTGGTLPSGSHQVVWQEDLGSEANRRRLVWETDGHLWVRNTVNSVEVASLDLGAVAVSTTIKVAIAYQQADFAASLNGGTVVSLSSGNCPGAHTLRIGRSFTGEAWAGTISKVHHRNTRIANASLVTLTS